MKGFLIVSPLLTRLLTFGKASAITLFPLIIVKSKVLSTNHTLLNHERIHLRQALELAVIFFYLLYFFEFIYHFIQLQSYHKAYMAISFEREAYDNESRKNYLFTRKKYAWAMYWKRKKY